MSFERSHGFEGLLPVLGLFVLCQIGCDPGATQDAVRASNGDAGATQEAENPSVGATAYTPPFAEGEPGWSNGSKPFCDPKLASQGTVSIWGDSRGVFALASRTGGDPVAGYAGDAGTSLWANQGRGWAMLMETEQVSPSLSGLPNGPLVVMPGLADDCQGIGFVDDAGKATCSYSEHSTRVHAAVDAKLAYFLSLGGEVLRYDGTNWSSYGNASADALALWADSRQVVAVGANRTFLVKNGDDAAFEQLPDAPEETYTTVWGFGPKDLWGGTIDSKLVHYRDGEWNVIRAAAAAEDGGILQLWGADDVLYYRTATEFGRVEDDTLEPLVAPAADGKWPDDGPSHRFTGMWGRSAKEVFLSAYDSNLANDPCGPYFVDWFDGTEFHRF